MTKVRAQLRYLRMSPRKVRLVVDCIRGLHVEQAERVLALHPRHAARPVLKLLQSAIANAEHNFKLQKKDLRIVHIVADGGPTLKRFRPRAFGSAAAILKRSCHVTIILESKEPVGEKKKSMKALTAGKGVSKDAKEKRQKTAHAEAAKKTVQATSTKKSAKH